MGQMAIQGVIYNKVMGAGFPGRPYVGTRGHRPGQGFLLGPWKGNYGVLGFSESGKRVLLFRRRRRDLEQQLSACGWCDDSLGDGGVAYQINLHIRYLHSDS